MNDEKKQGFIFFIYFIFEMTTNTWIRVAYTRCFHPQAIC